MFRLLRLTIREKKWISLAFLCSLFVALFNGVFINLVQPVIDNMFAGKPAIEERVDSKPQAGAPVQVRENPAVPAANPIQARGNPATPGKAQILDSLWRALHITKADIAKVLPWIIIIVLFGKGIFAFLASFFMRAVGNKVVKTMRDRLYAHILGQSAGFYDRSTTGDLMSRLTNDVDRIQQAVGTAMSDLFEELFVTLALLATMFAIDVKLALMSFVLAPLAVIPMVAFSRKLKKQGRKAQIKMAEMYDLIYETVSGHKIVKAFSMEKFELGRFLKASWRYFRINLRLAWVASLSSPFMEFVGGVVAAYILVIGAGRISSGQLTAGQFGAFFMAIFSLFTPIRKLSRSYNTVQQATACLDRVEEVLRQPPEIRDGPNAYPLPAVQGGIAFEKVGFAYQADRPVLHDISFAVEPRKTVALVGFSGAGKTTIINLLARFYEPTSGRVLLDGIDIRQVTLDSLRAQIGLVTQDIVLFNDTVKANIAYGLDDVPFERVEAAARAAECHAFICDLPQGYDTEIGERGGRLSSGQRQRLALARALLKNPPILILDEATSSLDSESERLIQQALANLMKNRTTVVIAHRLSTVRNADLILVVEKGRIVESGSHDKLIRKRGVYKKLYDLQFSAEEEPQP